MKLTLVFSEKEPSGQLISFDEGVIVTVDIEVIEGRDIDDLELGTNKDTEEFLTAEALILPFRMGLFPLRHARIAFEDDTRKHSDIIAVIAEFTHKAGVAIVDGTRDDA